MAKLISKPLSIAEEITIAFHMLKFFGTKYNKEIVRELGLSCKDNEFVKFTVNQFLEVKRGQVRFVKFKLLLISISRFFSTIESS